jgi:hypothetical protein
MLFGGKPDLICFFFLLSWSLCDLIWTWFFFLLVILVRYTSLPAGLHSHLLFALDAWNELARHWSHNITQMSRPALYVVVGSLLDWLKLAGCGRGLVVRWGQEHYCMLYEIITSVLLWSITRDWPLVRAHLHTLPHPLLSIVRQGRCWSGGIIQCLCSPGVSRTPGQPYSGPIYLTELFSLMQETQMLNFSVRCHHLDTNGCTQCTAFGRLYIFDTREACHWRLLILNKGTA